MANKSKIEEVTDEEAAKIKEDKAKAASGED